MFVGFLVCCLFVCCFGVVVVVYLLYLGFLGVFNSSLAGSNLKMTVNQWDLL